MRVTEAATEQSQGTSGTLCIGLGLCRLGRGRLVSGLASVHRWEHLSRPANLIQRTAVAGLCVTRSCCGGVGSTVMSLKKDA